MKLFLWRVALDDRVPALIFSMAETLDEARRAVLDSAVEWERPVLLRGMAGLPEVHDDAAGFSVWGAN